MMLDKLLVSGRPTNLEKSRGWVYSTCSRCGWGLFGHFSLIFRFSSFCLSLGDGPIETEILSERTVKPKTTNQPINSY